MTSDEAYLLGCKMAEEDSRSLIERLDQGSQSVVSDFNYWRGLHSVPVWLEQDFKDGYNFKWERELPLHELRRLTQMAKRRKFTY